jgi:uncharacterized membrane protein
VKFRFATDPGRLEAFSDGVMAVIITIMVLELKPPQGTNLEALHATLPTFLAYSLSFIYVGIYWNNHHHMLRAVKGIDGRVMWFNLALLFCLSLVPFTTSWLGENPSATIPTMLYGVVLLCCGLTFALLQFALIALNGRDGALAQAVATDVKGKGSVVVYLAAIGLAFVSPFISDALYLAVAVSWFIPDRRMERAILEVRGDAREQRG